MIHTAKLILKGLPGTGSTILSKMPGVFQAIAGVPAFHSV